MFDRWRKRAIDAEAQVTTLTIRLEAAQRAIDAIEQRHAKRAELVSIEQRGRVNKFLFVRAGKLVVVETYSTMSDDIGEWRRELLE